MLIEKINAASFANGILRIEIGTTNGKGEWVDSGTLEIPGGLVASIINQLSSAASDISDKLTQINEEEPSPSSNGKKDKEKDKKTTKKN
jgi:hypothetical protein